MITNINQTYLSSSACLGIRYLGTSANLTGILYCPGPGMSSFFYGDLSAFVKDKPVNVLLTVL